MERLIKRVFIIVSIIVLEIFILTGEVKAKLQANSNTHDKSQDTIANWMVNVRNMEKLGEAMGLSETLNTDLTSKSKSNNIDVHLLRSTEYGAVAILSASEYGNSLTLQESTIKTTTGNKSGVYFSGNKWEFVAGGSESKSTGAHNRYYDSYTYNQNSAKVGDALGDATTPNPGCAGWYSGSKYWINNGSYYFIRSNNGLFGFHHGYISDKHVARGVAVCGIGF